MYWLFVKPGILTRAGRRLKETSCTRPSARASEPRLSMLLDDNRAKAEVALRELARINIRLSALESRPALRTVSVWLGFRLRCLRAAQPTSSPRRSAPNPTQGARPHSNFAPVPASIPIISPPMPSAPLRRRQASTGAPLVRTLATAPRGTPRSSLARDLRSFAGKPRANHAFAVAASNDAAGKPESSGAHPMGYDEYIANRPGLPVVTVR
jgi:hypothetical protein